MPLYEKTNYLNKDIEYLISNEIIEYDMKSAGFNIIKKFKLLDDKRIAHLESLPNKRRHITIGLYQQNNKDFAKELSDKFVEMRRLFFEANELEDDDILSIKKDAIITTKRCYNTIFDNVEFVEKHMYTSYYYLSKFELYVGPTGIDMKGISDEKLKYHEDYMLDFLFRFFKLVETGSRKQIVSNLVQFANYYKKKELEIGYYRELNKDSLFKLEKNFIGDLIGVHHVDTIDNIDISFNYMKFIVPLIKLLI